MRETTFAGRPTPKRVEQLKSAEISPVGRNRWVRPVRPKSCERTAKVASALGEQRTPDHHERTLIHAGAMIARIV
ncbi:MAG: hypothetical protein SVX38_09390 [Chloroflexota bacterium]|nr:hypothetical protein [Chloroflexota bacterium]